MSHSSAGWREGDTLNLRFSGPTRLSSKGGCTRGMVLEGPVPITSQNRVRGVRDNRTILTHPHPWGLKFSTDSGMLSCCPFKGPPQPGRSTPAHAIQAPPRNARGPKLSGEF